MIRVVGIRFQQDGKMIHYDAGELSPQMGDYVVAQTARGNDLGEVILAVTEMEESQVKMPLMQVVRVATTQDIQQATDNRALEQEAYVICQQKILDHRLEMKLVSVECLFDRSKMMFYFTADGRVDFRALVRDLASTFRMRIELRQIGVRDEARMLGGLGPCGRPICCGAFLSDFQPVSIRMAKDQNLSLNPTKISGVCGRLMCCLKYEQDQYEQVRKRMPRVGRDVVTPDGVGTVTDLNIVKETVQVRIANGDSSEIREYPLDQISRPGARPAQQQVAPVVEAEAVEEDISLSDDDLMAAVEMDADTLAFLEDVEADLEDTEAVMPAPAPAPAPAPRRKEKNQRPSFGPRVRERNQEDAEGDEFEEVLGFEKKSDVRKQRNGNRPSRDRAKNGNNHGGKNGKPAREQRFGQPVRRENPDRKNRETGLNEAGTPEGASKPETSKKPPRKPVEKKAEKPAQNNHAEASQAQGANNSAPKSRGWADALEKAMQAADS